MRQPVGSKPRPLLLIALLIAATGTLVGGRQAPHLSDARLQRMRTWEHAVAGHVAGASDRHLAELATWDAADVTETVGDFLESRRSFWNHVLRRAAMLHADVALLATQDRSRETGAREGLLVLDGVVVRPLGHSAHWVVGRWLLDEIYPSPEKDAFVLRWYQATAAAMLEEGDLAGAKPHLDHALLVLPRDADVHFEIGRYHQAHTDPSILAVMRMRARIADRMNRSRFFVASDSENTKFHHTQAEKRFRQTIAIEPGHVEARMRLGMVLLQLNRASEAAGHLADAAQHGTDPTLLYFAQMLRGQAEERLGRSREAAVAYAKAATLFPEARSPQLAMAALDRGKGAREEAWAIAKPAVEPPMPEQRSADPWWIFFRWQSRPAAKLLAELRGMAGTR